MSVDKLVDSTQLDADLASVADAIRTKGGTSASLAFPAGFVSAVEAISTGGGVRRVVGTVVGNGTNTISITCDKPDMVVFYRDDIANVQAVADRAHAASIYRNGVMTASIYTAASSATFANSGVVGAPSISESSTPYNNLAGYKDGKLYVKSGNNSNLWSTSLTYNYELYYMP